MWKFCYETEDDVIDAAIAILESRASKPDFVLTSPGKTCEYLRLRIADEEREHFGALYLDNQLALITSEILFSGTVDGSAVYSREVVKAVLKHNAAAVIFFHNHPSNVVEPSQSDRRITERLVQALALIDVRVLDHIIVGKTDSCSFGERGLL